MTFNLLQVKDNQETVEVDRISVTLDEKPIEGSLLVCFVGTHQAKEPLRPDDTWQSGASDTFSTLFVKMFYKIAGSDEPLSITSKNQGGKDEMAIMVAEFESTSGEFFLGIDRFITNGATTTSPSLGPTSTTQRENELAIAAFAANGGNGGWDQIFTNGFTEIMSQGSASAGDVTISMAFKEIASKETVSVETGQGSSSDFSGVMQTFGIKQDPTKLIRNIEVVQTAIAQEVSDTTTITAILDSDPEPGNLLVLISGAMAGPTIIDTDHIPPSPSWLEHIFVKNTDGSSPFRQSIKVFTKIATDSDSTSFTITGDSVERGLIVAEFSGNFIGDELLDVSAERSPFDPNLTTITTGTTDESTSDGLAIAFFGRPGGGPKWSGEYTNDFISLAEMGVGVNDEDITMAAAYLPINKSDNYSTSTTIDVATLLFGGIVIFNNLLIQPDAPEQVGIKPVDEGCLINDCNAVSLTFPVGGELITNKELNINWHTPSPHSEEGTPLWYELFFTEHYDVNKDKQEWQQIASIPAGIDSFSWKIPFAIKSNRCRLAIRCRDHRGLRGPLMVAPGNFTIADREISSPAIFSPNEGETYRFFVPIIFDNDAIIETQSQRATYQVFYSSTKQNIDWTLIAQNVPVGSPPIFFDIRDLPPSDDYVLKVSLVDDSGDSSVPIFIRDLTFSPLSFFILDTTPPKGDVIIEDNAEFINKRDIILSLTAFDEATDIKSVTLQQREDDALTQSREDQEFANVNTWLITGDDGIKTIEALFKDFAGNAPVKDGTQRAFRQFVSNENNPIGALLLVRSSNELQVWTAFGGDTPVLFKNRSVAFSLDGEPTALELFNSNIYIATKTEDNTGVLHRIVANEIEDIQEFDDFDSFIKTMTVFNNELYIGLQNGEIHKFNGTSISLFQDMSSAINKLVSDNSLLYIFLDNTEDIIIFDGLAFNTAEVIDGSQQV